MQKKHLNDVTRPYYLESMLQIVMLFCIIGGLFLFWFLMDAYALFFSDGSFNYMYLVLILPLGLIFRNLRLMLLIFWDKISSNIKSVKAHYLKFGFEWTFGKKDYTSCVGMFYPKEADVNRYIVTIADIENDMRKLRFRICLPWKQFTYFLIISGKTDFTVHYLGKSKIIVGITINEYKSGDKEFDEAISKFDYLI